MFCTAPIFYTICLLSSSLTIHIAVRKLIAGSDGSLCALVAAHNSAGRRHSSSERRASGIHLIFDEGLTMSTNLFGTTYYSLVGLHAFHVTMGLLAL